MDDTHGSGPSSSVSGVGLRVLVDAQTYKNLLYLLLAFPLGFLYGMTLGFGFVFGLIATVVVVGIGILIAVVIGSRLAAGLERWLANALLRTSLSPPDDRPDTGGVLATVKGYLDAPSTWRGLGFLSMKLWVGIVGLLLVFLLWNAVELMTAPLRYPVGIEFGTVNGEPVVWTIDVLPEAALAVPIGVVLGLVVLHLTNGIAYVVERMAVALLDGTEVHG